jgi:hypothetical protein
MTVADFPDYRIVSECVGQRAGEAEACCRRPRPAGQKGLLLHGTVRLQSRVVRSSRVRPRVGHEPRT